MSDSQESSVDGENVNWHVVNPTNAAQYFHLLRRQARSGTLNIFNTIN